MPCGLSLLNRHVAAGGLLMAAQETRAKDVK